MGITLGGLFRNQPDPTSYIPIKGTLQTTETPFSQPNDTTTSIPKEGEVEASINLDWKQYTYMDGLSEKIGDAYTGGFIEPSLYGLGIAGGVIRILDRNRSPNLAKKMGRWGFSMAVGGLAISMIR